MNKLYIDQQGIIKVIDVPEEPKFIDTMEYIENCLNDKAMKEYKKALASAKEAGIEVADQEHGKEIICYELYGGPQVDIPWSVTVKNWSDEIFGIPEGWRVKIKERDVTTGYRPSPTANIINNTVHFKVAVLLPPVSQCDYREGCGTVDCTCGKVES